MNTNDPNTQTNSNTAFSQHSGLHNTQSNPFTGDLKGEFTSDFGTNTNAVSQIFKGGGFTEDRKKAIFIGLAVLLVLGLAFVFLSGGEEEAAEEEVAEETEGMEEGAEGEEATAEEEGAEGESTEEEAAATSESTETATAEAPAPAEAAAPEAAPAGTGAIAISSPNDGAQKDYDETQGPAVFEWSGAADRIVFSRNQSMNPIVRSVALGGASSYSFGHPYPGTWYWRVENASGASEVRRFVVNAPPRRNFPVSQPTTGGSIAGNGGVVQWEAGEKVARYQVQLKPEGGGSWGNAPYRFGTSGNSVSLNGIPAGKYDMRVGAFSEVAGRWEWQEIAGITVQ